MDVYISNVSIILCTQNVSLLLCMSREKKKEVHKLKLIIMNYDVIHTKQIYSQNTNLNKTIQSKHNIYIILLPLKRDKIQRILANRKIK